MMRSPKQIPIRLTVAVVAILLFGIKSIISQDIIVLKNPSFEDPLGQLDNSSEWTDCGFEDESPPDIQPSGMWMPHPIAAFDGMTYLGMVTRDNETWESVGQKLSKPIKQGEHYLFSLHLAKSNEYISGSRIRNVGKVTYNTPLIINIWGGREKCDFADLLASSPVVDHTDWKKYDFIFVPDEDWDHLIIEAYYSDDSLDPSLGNILVDNCSSIVKTSFDKGSIVKSEKSINNKALYEAIIEYTKAFKLRSKTETPSTMMVLYNLHKFEAEIKSVGLNTYISRHSKNDIWKSISLLQEINLENSANTLIETMNIIKGDSHTDLTTTEIEMIGKSNDFFQNNLRKEGLLEKIYGYIEEHKSLLMIEIKTMENSDFKLSSQRDDRTILLS